jgi:1-acyl-sn-glycerol-3-phosphate acyltransferase
VDRRSRHDFVSQVVELYRTHERMVLVMAPEGTRGRTDRWKTGFYWIAHGAGVPIVLGFLDWGAQEAGAGPLLWPTGDIEADFEVIRAFYAGKKGRHGDRMGEVAIRPAGT